MTTPQPVSVDLKSLPFAARKGVQTLQKVWAFGTLHIVFPDGRSLSLTGDQPGPAGTLLVKDFHFMKRVLTSGDIGFCDGYKEGEWDTPDLATLLEVLTLNSEKLGQLFTGNIVTRTINNWLHGLRKNTKKGSQRNIFAHYDLGNSFYDQWLDQSMTYSSALFDGDKFQTSQDLSAAQTAKYARLAQLVDLKPGQHVLEIGCGWGGFAQYAAEMGAHVTGVTISPAQADYAIARMAKLGLSDRVDIRLMDYRDIEGQFDAVVSIEMFEAVGETYWGAYFDKLRDVLKKGGKAGLQIITIADDMFEDYKSRADFIQKYVFPGGMLPSAQKLVEQTQRAGLNLVSNFRFGQDYAETLKQWGQRFEAAWKEGRIQGFDAQFRKLWLFYLAYCEAGFRTERTNVVHLQLQRAD
ncbi:cyclopropane-fatty-acyl-phospholipid synthase family protein [Asticcacaulis sp. EMRT-3]|uniref:cyclopropane-fatty-acyl-phospholipid synthase family protein n=1 Tax=Asticcacaulis sp. EMRT-3 TaxID=3040349 RepID=UPI0024AF329D|nr:cyclopropane-fatty-acyl-phospholipid synthase family protein [Asticcacaulis sp. EMRT-3]MDI7774007.1 cyclopropane-fatty-acyl-phospholipid synthase family protein [Asticcacaulis sp. EMRT-3]